MKVTFVLPHAGYSGGTRMALTYASRLAQRGHRVVVVSTPRKKPSWKSRIRSLLTFKGRKTGSPRPPVSVRAPDVDHRVLERFRPVTDADVPDADIVIATWWSTAYWVAELSPPKGAKFLFIQGYEVMPGESNPELDGSWKLPLRKIVISRWLKNLAEERFGDPDAILVPNAIDPRQFFAPLRKKQDRPTVGLMYGPSRFKGVDYCLRAFELARETVPDLRLRSFGAYEPAPELPLPEGCEFSFMPPVETIREIYSGCDAWLFGSRREGFGLPILEAMACRTPVIGTPAGAAPELLESGGGTLVDPENPGEMAEAIVQFCRMSEEEWRRRSEAAYSTATAYTLDEAVLKLEQALTPGAGGNDSGKGRPESPRDPA